MSSDLEEWVTVRCGNSHLSDVIWVRRDLASLFDRSLHNGTQRVAPRHILTEQANQLHGTLSYQLMAIREETEEAGNNCKTTE